jgi:CRISPR-associated protein Csm5
VTDSTPLFAEMATPGTTFTGVWKERKFLESQELARFLGWRSAPDPKTIFGAVNQYAGAQLDLHARYAEAAELPALGNVVGRLRNELESVKADQSACLVCLGWGGGFVSKAGFLDTEDTAYRKLLRAVPAISRSIRDGVPFPKTRRVIFVGGQPASLPGWARLHISEE